jgi:hypothetical protein
MSFSHYHGVVYNVLCLMQNQNTGNIILVGCLHIEDLEHRYSGNECVCIWCEILVILPELYDKKCADMNV